MVFQVNSRTELDHTMGMKNGPIKSFFSCVHCLVHLGPFKRCDQTRDTAYLIEIQLTVRCREFLLLGRSWWERLAPWRTGNWPLLRLGRRPPVSRWPWLAGGQRGQAWTWCSGGLAGGPATSAASRCQLRSPVKQTELIRHKICESQGSRKGGQGDPKFWNNKKTA